MKEINIHKRTYMKTLILLLICVSATNTLISQNQYFEIYTDSTELKVQNDALIQDIEKTIAEKHKGFSFNGLTTEIPATFMPGHYLEKTNKIYLPLWQTSIPAMDPFLTDVGGDKETAMKLADLFFYGFFLPHEIGHALQYNTKRVPDNAYDAEYEANEFAVAYWRSKGRQKELEVCYQLAKQVFPKLKNPVPENTDAKKYITENYWELVKKPLRIWVHPISSNHSGDGR